MNWLRISSIIVNCVIIFGKDSNPIGTELETDVGEHFDRRVSMAKTQNVPSSAGACYGKDIYQGDIIADGWFQTVYGNQNAMESYKNDQPTKFSSKKVQRLRLTRNAQKTDERASRSRRAATAVRSHLWPNRTIPYVIDDVFDNKTIDLLTQGMKHWEQYTCLRFEPRQNQTGYMKIVHSDGCCSSVGYFGTKQLVSIGKGCDTLGVIVHELGHAIGFWHEQNRPDRDNHVDVMEENVADYGKHNFVKYDNTLIDSMGQPYDLESVMHYSSTSFSKNRQDTIVPKNGDQIGEGRVLSVGDIIQANLLYRCSVMTGACGGVIFEPEGQIFSPKYPDLFAPNTTCDWSIGVGEGSGLKLEFMDIDLPMPNVDGKCETSYIELREGLGELSPLIGRYCGSHLPNPITCDGGNIWIRFKSGTNRNLGMAGFVIRFKSVSLQQTLSAPSGTLKSLNYPLSFPPGTDVVWLITLQYGFIVNLIIEELLIPRSSKTGCLGDYLLILDGAKSRSPMITKLCQSQTRVGVASSGQDLRLEMHSMMPTTPRDSRHMDHMDAGQIFNELPTRFHARYAARDVNECQTNQGGCEQACLNMFGGFVCGCQYGYTIASNYKNCTDVNECLSENGGCSHICMNTEGAYHCACPTGFYLSPQNKTHCVDENECDDPERNQCEQHCHNTMGGYACSCAPGYLLDTDDLNCIGLHSCGGHLDDLEGSLLSPVLPEGNNNSFDCVWQISVAEDLSIDLRFFFDYWPESQQCHSYIDIFEGRGPTSEHQRICDNIDDYNDADIYQTASEMIWVHYHSIGGQEVEFQIDYYTRMKDNLTIECGGVLNGTGTLQSPGYPDEYPNRVECIWKITGKSIRLYFENFDLEKEQDCKFDFLDIRDGHHQEPLSRHIGRFCGNSIPPTELESSTGELYIEFQSDATVQGRGFRAMFAVETS